MANPLLKIRPITEQNLADRVERRILEYINTKDFKQGESLPTELEFAEAIGVSRNVIREAFSRLRMMGYIKSKRRSGMVLEYPDVFGVMSRVMNPLMMSETTQIDLLEFRMILEIGLAELVFERKTNENMIEIEDLLDKQSLNDTGVETIQDNIDFHYLIFKMSGNVYLSNYQNLLEWIFKFVDKYYKTAGISQEVSGISHSDIYNELKHGTPDGFRSAIKKHLEPHKHVINQKKREMADHSHASA